MDIKEFAEEFIKAEKEAFQNFNFEPLKAIEDPNVVYHLYPPPDLIGHEAHKQQIMQAHKYLADLKQEFEYLTGSGDLFAYAYKGRYISAGKLPGWPPAGGEATNDSLFLVRRKNDKVVEVWSNGHITGIDLEAGLKTTEK
jgi:predicted ester cyclase